MKILHVLRSEADLNVEKFIDILSEGNESTVAPLYQEDVDWSRLVNDIFAHDKVVCWW